MIIGILLGLSLVVLAGSLLLLLVSGLGSFLFDGSITGAVLGISRYNSLLVASFFVSLIAVWYLISLLRRRHHELLEL